jgi:flagellar biogenesis protein FliO
VFSPVAPLLLNYGYDRMTANLTQTASWQLQSTLECLKQAKPRPSTIASFHRSITPFRAHAQCGLAALLMFAAAPAGFAQATNTLTLHSDLPEVGLSAIRALGALALVLAVFFGGVWLFRNGQRLAWRKTGAPRLTILESRPLGNRFALYVVGYDQQRMLIGSSPAGISLLSQLPPAADSEPELAAPEKTVSFTQCLQQVLRRK